MTYNQVYCRTRCMLHTVYTVGCGGVRHMDTNVLAWCVVNKNLVNSLVNTAARGEHACVL